MQLYFEIMGLRIPAYSTMALAGFLCALVVARKLAKNIMTYDFWCAISYGGIAMIAGAKLFYAIPFLIQGNTGNLRELFAGYVFYGGMLGMTAGIAFYARMRKQPVTMYLDILAVVIPLFHGFGRLGCFFAGCCYGREYHGIFAVHFPANPYEPGIELVPRVPVQIMESLCNFLLFFFLLCYRKKKPAPGRIMGLYLTIYPAVRFLLEMLRGDIVRGVYQIAGIAFSTSQLISVVLFTTGIVLIRHKIPENDMKNKKSEKKFQKNKG